MNTNLPLPSSTSFANSRDRMSRNTVEFDSLPDSALIAIRTVAEVLGIGISTAWRRKSEDCRFPAAIRLSSRCTRFRVADLRANLNMISTGHQTADALHSSTAVKRRRVDD